METEQSLEDVLKRVGDLGKDIPSEKVRKERLVHPNRNSRSCDNHINQLIEEAAEDGLTEIFETFPWYSARYQAGLHLMVADGYSIPRILEEERKLVIFFAQNFQFLMQTKDEEELKRLKHDFNTLYNLVPFKYLRKRIACEVMGYSKLRFLAMEHPIAAKAAGIAAAVGAVSGIVYGLMEYFVD